MGVFSAVSDPILQSGMSRIVGDDEQGKKCMDFLWMRVFSPSYHSQIPILRTRMIRHVNFYHREPTTRRIQLLYIRERWFDK